MELYVDTREHKKEYDRIAAQLDSLGVKHFRTKIFVGDYQSLDNPRLVVDRKKGLLEVCGNLTSQHVRFRAELQRALDANIHIIILVENDDGITCTDDVPQWINPRRCIMCWYTDKKTGKKKRKPKYPYATQGSQLYKMMMTMAEKYGVEWRFCRPEDTGKTIVKLLEVVE